jgi:hypothetical protein
MAGRGRDDQGRGTGEMQPGLTMTYTVTICEDGRYCVKFVTPTGQSVIVGQFFSEQDARAWIGAAATAPEETA